MHFSALKALVFASAICMGISPAGAVQPYCTNKIPFLLLQGPLKDNPTLRKQMLNIMADVLKMDKATTRQGPATADSLLHEWENGHFQGENGYLPGLSSSLHGIEFRFLTLRYMETVLRTMAGIVVPRIELLAKGTPGRMTPEEIWKRFQAYFILYRIYAEVTNPIPHILRLFFANVAQVQGTVPPASMMEQVTQAAQETSRLSFRQSIHLLTAWEDRRLKESGYLPGLSPKEQGRRYLELPDILRLQVRKTFAFTPIAETLRFMEAHPGTTHLPDSVINLFRIQIVLEILYKEFYRSPDYVENGSPAIRNLFHRFLRRHSTSPIFVKNFVKNEPIQHLRVSPTLSVYLSRFFLDSSVLPEHSQFNSLDDTITYARLLNEALSLISPDEADNLIDLGAGSSIPTLIALRKSARHHALHVTAVDIDGDALEVSQRNSRLFNLEARYTFVHGHLLEFLRRQTLTPRSIVAANPPYLPMPGGITDPKFTAVNGGLDGTEYITRILEHPFPPGTHVVLTWSSLSNPAKIIPLIEQHYDVLFVQALEVPFGVYTSSAALLPHIQAQTESGAAIYSIHSAHTARSYTVVGVILRKK